MHLSQMNRHQKEKYLEYLTGFITSQRRSKIDEVSKNRTQYITIVLEDIYQPHNASAVRWHVRSNPLRRWSDLS